MKKIILFYIFCFSAATPFAQKETFDIVSFTPPKGINGKEWKKETANNIIAYTLINAKNNSWCRINIVKSTVSNGSIEKDFESEWDQLIVRNYKPTEAPQLDTIKETEGWKIKSGITKFNFNNQEAIALLTTATGYNRCVSIVVTTNSQDYTQDIEGLLGSVELQKQISSEQEPLNQYVPGSVIGTWGVGTTIASSYNFNTNEGSIVTEYRFNENGTYSFYRKTFRYQLDKLLLTRETGTYKLNGKNITLNPQTSTVESWSKKDGTDKWGKLLSSQKRELEKTTYEYFTQDFGLGPVLVLKAPKETKRDGVFNNMEKDSYYYPAQSPASWIQLPETKQTTTDQTGLVNSSTDDNSKLILGTWSKSGSAHETYGDPVSHGNAGYTTSQYSFHANGKYNFVSKTFRSSHEKILLIKENGTYQFSGNNLSINPEKSLIEEWTKKDGTDKYGKLVSTQNRKLEKITYVLTRHFFTGIQQWNLVFQADKPTLRDGPFSNNTTFTNAWYYVPISTNNTLIELPTAK